MKRSLIALTFGLLATQAYADNPAIENALKNRSDLSDFYQALVSTGVIHEIGSGPYTIFAPTNKAFAKIDQNEYPCFYSQSSTCQPQLAAILRNHIVRGTENLSDVTKFKGAVFAINGREVNIGSYSSDSRRPDADLGNDYTVAGHRVLSESQIGGVDMLYPISGVIVNPRELASLEGMQVSDREETDRTYYSPDGRPDGDTETDTVTRTIYNAAPAR